MTFGEFIKEKRTEKGLSQRKLSVLCELSNAEISRIENGERKYYSVETLIKLSKGLNVSAMELIEAYIKERA